MSVQQVSEIWVYPVKSLGGISVARAQVQRKGLKWDRRWMLVDEQHQFMTQRTLPALALFKTKLTDAELVVVHGADEVNIPLAEAADADLFPATVWEDQVLVAEVDPAISAWFSKKLGMNCKLVQFPEDRVRPVDPRYRISDDHVSLADAYPLLIIGQASLDDLNKRLSSPVPMNRFRPNVVFTGGLPYAEDAWTRFRIGGNRFAAVKPCSRCVLTTIDQTSGEKGVEPLATLASYRKRDSKIYFGQNLIALDYETIAVGDDILLD